MHSWRHAGERRHPVVFCFAAILKTWIPAFAGMTGAFCSAYKRKQAV